MTPAPIRRKRKVQRLGSSTLAVTIPADWVRHHEVEKGDELLVQREEHGSALLVAPDQPATEDAEATVDADALTAHGLEQAIVTQYVLGRELVRIETTDPLGRAHRDAILDAESRLMGLGIVEQSPTAVTLRCSVAPEDFDLSTLLGRLSRTEATMRTDALAALVDAESATATRVADRNEQVQTLYSLFCRLVLTAHRNPNHSQPLPLETGFPLTGYQSVARNLLLMTDAAVDIAGLVTETDRIVPDEETSDLLGSLGDALDGAAGATIAAVTAPELQSVEEARAAFEEVDELVAAANDHLATERPEPLLALQRAVVLLERGAGYARDSLSVASQLAVRDDLQTGE